MSRCFPFPPPGYEKKLRVEDVTLLAKEKDKEKKEKKHKKDKDKEKKEGREKDKEKSKERHKEKDKNKSRDKKSGKKRSRDEKTFEGDRSKVEKVGSSSPQSSCVQELEQRISFVDGATGSQTVHRIYDKDQGKAKLLDGVASRSNGAYWTEDKSGLEQMANGQKDICSPKFPKVAFVFGNGTEQRTVQTGRPMENNSIKSTEAKQMQKHHKSKKKEEKSKDKSAKRHKGQAEICTPQTFGYNGSQIDPPKEAAIVQELERRIRDDNGATGSQVVAKPKITIQRRADSSEKMANGIAFSSPQTKENTIFGNGSCRLENGHNDNRQPKVPKVAIVRNFKVEERGCEMVGVVDTSKKVQGRGMERNGFSGEGAVDNRMKIQSKDETGNKPGREDRVKEETDNVVKLPRFRQSDSDSTDSFKHYTVKMGNKTAEAITGKRKEPEANGIVVGKETRPNKWQKAVLSSQRAAENGRHLKSGTTITLSACKQGSPNGFQLDGEACKKSPANSFKMDGEACKRGPANGYKLDGEDCKSNWTVPAQSPPAQKNSQSSSVEPVGTLRSQSSLGLTKPSISARADGQVGMQGPSFGPAKPQSSIEKFRGTTVAEEAHLISAKPLLAGGNDNGTIVASGSVLSTAKAVLPLEKVHEIAVCEELAKPQSSTGKVNGTTGALGLPPVTPKPPSTSRKEKRKDKSSSKPPPPHPDTKYLSQILSIPTLEELPELDNPEWLFGRKSFSSKESDVGHDRDEGEQVWAKAVHIEAADVYALPYVIPH